MKARRSADALAEAVAKAYASAFPNAEAFAEACEFGSGICEKVKRWADPEPWCHFVGQPCSKEKRDEFASRAIAEAGMELSRKRCSEAGQPCS